MTVTILNGDCRELLKTLPEQSVQCCVTSPPYFGLRDYGVDGQIGLEPTPDAFVAEMVAVFREVRRVLKDDGTLWLNLGDSYNAYNGGAGPSSSLSKGAQTKARPQLETGYGLKFKGLKPKDLIGIPWRVAFALQADGWWLRQDIIWAKPNPMPESVRDRCTKAHKYIFLLSKSERYYFDSKAIAEPAVGQNEHDLTGSGYSAPGQTPQGGNRGPASHKGSSFHTGKTAEHQLGRASSKPRRPQRVRAEEIAKERGLTDDDGKRNKRSVWTVATQPFSEAHFATFPPELPEICIKAGSKPGDSVLDCFGGAGTTGLVADRLNRNAILCELNPAYAAMARRRIEGDAPLFAQVSA